MRSYEELRIVEAQGLNTLDVVEPAIEPDPQGGSARLRTIFLAALGGLLVAVVAALIAEYLDDGLRDRERVLKSTGL